MVQPTHVDQDEADLKDRRHHAFAERTGFNPDREQFVIGLAIVAVSVLPLVLVLVW